MAHILIPIHAIKTERLGKPSRGKLIEDILRWKCSQGWLLGSRVSDIKGLAGKVEIHIQATFSAFLGNSNEAEYDPLLTVGGF